MKVLLDTNALIWWMEDDPQLGPKARATLADPANTVMATIVSIWEITMKWRVGKFPWPGSTYNDFLAAENIGLVRVESSHLEMLESLPYHHKDPFDHLILAQAKVESAAIITSDRELALYGVRCFPAMR
ncbi:MAG: type II toxin-antitoxin system VapC family toxin [Sphingopyxis sp.]|nr:type II toxin-antitoxin system VapC family toxin [Sphingopyxis sp.]